MSLPPQRDHAGGDHPGGVRPLAILYMKQPVKLDYLWASLCMMGACTSFSVDNKRENSAIWWSKAPSAGTPAWRAARPRGWPNVRAAGRNPFLERFTTTCRATLQVQPFFLFQRLRIPRSLAQPTIRSADGGRLPARQGSPARYHVVGRRAGALREDLRGRCVAPARESGDSPAGAAGHAHRRAGGAATSAASAGRTWRCRRRLRPLLPLPAAPVLIVNSENLNFVERDADFELLVSRMRGMKSRREFFNLG